MIEVGQLHFSVHLRKKLLNLAIITKTPQIYYRISYIKNQGFEKTPLFFESEVVQLQSWIVRRFFNRFSIFQK